MTKDREIPEFGDPETRGLTVDEYENKYHSGLGDTWKYLRQTESPEEKLQYDEVELQSLKRGAIRFNKDVKKFRDISGHSYKFNEAHKINRDIRKKASVILKDNNTLNKFMSAPDFESYQSGPKHAVVPSANPKADQVISDHETSRELFQGIDAIIEKYSK
jgi:hypothetical protein